MKYLKKFETYNLVDKTINVKKGTYKVGNEKETDKNTIYDKSWESYLPHKFSVDYHNKKYTYTKGNIMINEDMVQISYESDEESPDTPGIPETLEFDIYFVKDVSNDKIRLTVDITFGDLMACEFSVEPPNLIKVIEYTSYHSKFDRSDTVFALSNNSLNKFINFLNKFDDMKLSINDFDFLDKYDDYQPN